MVGSRWCSIGLPRLKRKTYSLLMEMPKATSSILLKLIVMSALPAQLRALREAGEVTAVLSVLCLVKLTSLCKDTRCKCVLNVRTAQSVANHCILTSVTPLSKDNAISGQRSWEPKQSLPKEVTVCWLDTLGIELHIAAFTCITADKLLTFEVALEQEVM